MPVTNNGLNAISERVVSGGTSFPTALAIGSGSGTALKTNTALVAEVKSGVFSTTDTSTLRETEWISDFNSVQMSGINLSEFGLKDNSGSTWTREAFGSVVFDGTNELQVAIRLKFF